MDSSEISISSVIKSAVTDTIETNASFQSSAGIRAKIKRVAHAGCCDTCAALEGEWYYDEAPDDVYWRHGNCTCTVTYDPGTGKVQNVHTKVWSESEEILEQRKQVALNTESQRRKISIQGQEIIDKATYNKITKTFLKNEGIIVRGKEAEKHLTNVNATASYIIGGRVAFIRDEATISDVLEEMFHAQQDRESHFGTELSYETLLLREIEAQNYLLKNIEKYKIPAAETEITKQNLAYYESELEKIRGKK